MGTKIAHVEQAHHNENFFHFLNNDGIYNTLYRDWIISAVYYAAVNYIEAYIYEKIPEKHSDQVARARNLKSPHEAREKIISDKFPTLMTKHYKTLKGASEKVRYAKVNFKTFYRKQDVSKFINTDLGFIKRVINF